MLQTSRLRSRLAMGVSAAAFLSVAGPALAQQPPRETGPTVIEELVVTAQRREEALQDVPIAVTALSGESLQNQRIEGGQDLLQQVPNVSFGRGNFGGYNFQIRGIGTALVTSTGDAGVGVHANNVPQISNNLGDAEFFDVERVEVLRGPQGTLYGRNATGGVVNIITAKPVSDLSGSITGDFGNFNTRRVKGYLNVPLTETFAVRAAGIVLKRDGFFENSFTGNDNDDRDLYSARVTAQWDPTDRFTAYALYSRFEENDNRNRVGKQLCRRDPGLGAIGGVPTNAVTRNFFSQGCLDGSIYGPENLTALNSAQSLAGYYGTAIGLSSGDLNADTRLDPDYRKIESVIDPTYKSESEIFETFAAFDITDSLTLSAQLSHTRGDYFTRADYNRSIPSGTFNSSFTVPGIAVGGVVDDPQVGRANTLITQDIQSGTSEQDTVEIRLQSDFDGPLNFSLGGNSIEYDSQSDYYVFSNGLNTPARLLFPASLLDLGNPPSRVDARNIYDNRTVYQLKSQSFFGEVYWEPTDTLKVTAGLRHNNDEKEATNFSTVLLSADPQVQTVQSVTFEETTGRINVDWQPELGFTDATLIYAGYSRGYKGGGFNPPGAVGLAGVETSFEPEFVDAFEVGTKNTLLEGRLLLNLTGFFYKYAGYQISKIVNRTSVNENIDAEIKGLELESIYEPVRNLRFNATLGYLDTEITSGTSIDTLNRTQSDPAFQVLKDLTTSNCIARVSDLARVQGLVNAGALPALQPTGLFNSPNYFLSCTGLQALAGLSAAPQSPANPLGGNALGFSTTNPALIVQEGFAVDLVGNDLPNSPKTTVSVGAQYTFEFGDSWSLTPRADYYYQGKQFSRIYNSAHDRLESYDIINLSLVLENTDLGLTVQGYVKNLADDDSIQATYLTDDSSGLYTNIQITDPRVYGIAITKTF